LADGSALVQCGTQDLGTGTYTIMAQVAADALGLAPERIKIELGDSDLPEAPVSGGSMTAASVTPPVQAAALRVRDRLIAMAVDDPASPLHGAEAGDVDVVNGWLQHRDNYAREPFAAIIARAGGNAIEEEAGAPEKSDRFTANSWGAVFADVAV